MENIFEVVRIKQEIKETEHPSAWYKVSSPEDVVAIAEKEIAYEDREVFFIACLNTKAKVVAIHRVHVGALSQSLVSTRETFKTAILNNAASIIAFHQHPSGNSQPSKEDENVTKKLSKSGQLLDIPLLDHIIISYTGEHTSLKEKGFL